MIIYYSTEVSDTELILHGDEHRHCSKVTRRKVGDTVYVTDGQGHLYQATIRQQDRSTTTLEPQEVHLQPRRPLTFRLAIAPTKNISRTEWLLEKAIEVGIEEVALLETHRGERRKVKMDRLQRIAIGAMKQSKNLWMPTIKAPQPIQSYLGAPTVSRRYVAHCNDVRQHLAHHLIKDQPSDITLFVGPEGDFTAEEVALLIASGAQEVNLGRSRLRTETAGIVGCTIAATIYDGIVAHG